VIKHRSNLAVLISSILAYNHTQGNHLDNIGGIRTRAIEIVNVFEMEFRWEKDICQIFGAKRPAFGSSRPGPRAVPRKVNKLARWGQFSAEGCEFKCCNSRDDVPKNVTTLQ
jgi:hypothetical protein